MINILKHINHGADARRLQAPPAHHQSRPSPLLLSRVVPTSVRTTAAPYEARTKGSGSIPKSGIERWGREGGKLWNQVEEITAPLFAKGLRLLGGYSPPLGTS